MSVGWTVKIRKHKKRFDTFKEVVEYLHSKGIKDSSTTIRRVFTTQAPADYDIKKLLLDEDVKKDIRRDQQTRYKRGYRERKRTDDEFTSRRREYARKYYKENRARVYRYKKKQPDIEKEIDRIIVALRRSGAKLDGFLDEDSKAELKTKLDDHIEKYIIDTENKIE